MKSKCVCVRWACRIADFVNVTQFDPFLARKIPCLTLQSCTRLGASSLTIIDEACSAKSIIAVRIGRIP